MFARQIVYFLFVYACNYNIKFYIAKWIACASMPSPAFTLAFAATPWNVCVIFAHPAGVIASVADHRLTAH